MVTDMKKLIAAALIAVSFSLLASCEKKKERKADEPVIGIAKLISHSSLNDAEQGMLDELKDLGVKANIDLQNANGDMNVAMSIANKFKSDNIDIAVGIATPMTVALVNVMPETPVVFMAVTDPVRAGLASSFTQGNKNITGVVDTIPIKEQLYEFRKLYPFKKLGVIYTSSESNSLSMAETTKQVCDEMGVELIIQTITNPSEVKQAAESMVGRVDAFYCFTDNSIATGMASIADTAKYNKIPVFGGDITPTLNGGVVYALGFSYYEMGRMAGKLVSEILKGQKPDTMPILSLNDPKYYSKLIDLDAAENLGLEIPETLLNEAKYIIKKGQLTER